MDWRANHSAWLRRMAADPMSRPYETALELCMTSITPTALGFTPIDGGWQRMIRGRTLTFRQLRDRAAFAQVERLQREVFGIADRDLTSATLLVVIPKTGGDILGAFDGDDLVGFLSAFGGYVNSRPRLVSDMLAVMTPWRGGLGFAL